MEAAKQQVTAVLDPLIAGLNAVCCSSAAKPAAATPRRWLIPSHGETAAQLTKLLSEFDPGAADFIEANRAALQPLFHDGTSGGV